MEPIDRLFAQSSQQLIYKSRIENQTVLKLLYQTPVGIVRNFNLPGLEKKH